jgi:site-specific DNA recombinase
MNAALYARYSTELQSADSIEDQFRVCQRLSERHGFKVVERYSDAAISGGTTVRPGYQELLRAARDKQFNIIIAEDTSRLWRSLPEQWRAVAELMDSGVHIVTQDIDTRAENFKILLSVHGAMADVYRDQIAYRTRRGLEGRARSGKSTGGRAYGYLAARDSATGDREIHPEQAGTVRQIFQWYADGKSPRWIARELNERGIPSPGTSWNRTSERLNAKRKRGWVPSAIHGDRHRGTGILNNRIYIGELIWNRSTWRRSAADSNQRRWTMNAADQLVKHQEERLRIVPQDLWNAVKTRQREIEGMSVKLRGVLKHRGRAPRHLLSGLLVCEQCGGTFRRVNGREFGCASYADGGKAACSNGIRVRNELAERKLLSELAEEILSPTGIALLERKIREYSRDQARAPKVEVKPMGTQTAKKNAEISQLRALMKSGTLSQAVAQAAIEKAEDELRELERAQPAQSERQVNRILRMLPRAAEMLRERIGAGNLGLRDPRSIMQGRNVLFGLFGGKVPLRPAPLEVGERPYLLARVAVNRSVLLQAAANAAGCLEIGSGGRI